MFKTLIATCLLSFSSSVGALQQTPYHESITEKRNVSYVGSSKVLRGSYVFRDNPQVDLVSNTLNISISFDLDSVAKEVCIFASLDDVSYATLSLSSFTMGYTMGDLVGRYSFNMQGSVNNTNYGIKLNPTVVYSTVTLPILNGMLTYTTIRSRLQDFVISFNRDFYLYGDEINLFDTFFTPNGNSYSPYYNGYYHYNNGNWLNTSYQFNYDGFGLFIVKNKICNSYIHSLPDNSTAGLDEWMVGYGLRVRDTDGSYYIWSYLLGEYETDVSNVQINSIIPRYVKQCMESEGVFMYIDDTPDVSWYEMLLSVMDAPLYFLRNLLSPTLFGLNLFVAFAGLLTLLLIVTIIKKVI